MREFNIMSTSDLLDIDQINALDADELVAYGQTVCEFGDAHAGDLTEDERGEVIFQAKYAEAQAKVILLEKRMSKMHTDSNALRPPEKQYRNEIVTQKVSDKNHTTALLLGIFLGWLGIHRFYAGKIGTAILWMLTAGVFGVGWFVDVVHLLGNVFEDWSGAPIVSEKGKARVAANGYSSQKNAVPFVFCCIFAAIGALAALGVWARVILPSLSVFGLHPYVLAALAVYFCGVTWAISSRGLE